MNKERSQKALELSEEILENLELNQIPLKQICLKCLRLARIINDFEAFEWLKFEVYGFETDHTNGLLTAKSIKAAVKSGRQTIKTEKDKQPQTAFWTDTIAVLETRIEIAEQRLKISYDPNISISTQSQFPPPIPNNAIERNMLSNTIQGNTEVIEKVKGRIYEYIVNVNYELKFGDIIEDIFTKKRNYIDKIIKGISPEATQKFISVYENLESSNDEDWANAVHSCRRILKEVADKLYPPDVQSVTKEDGKQIKVGEDQYINRLILYVESKSSSDKFNSIVGSQLSFLGERLDSVHEATNKGTHHEVTLEEAERYIIYTYLLLGDILSLNTEQENSENISNDTK